MPSAPPASGNNVYTTCSLSSSGETADNLPGPGRLLGNAYGFLGRKLENGLCQAAEKLFHLNLRANHIAPPGEIACPLQPANVDDSAFQSTADDYTLCSISDSNETADNLPGPGRTLGNAYFFFGRKLENRLSWAAERLLHRGPRITALRIQIIYDDESISTSARNKKIEKKCQRLNRYVLSNVPSTRGQALEQIIKLSVYANSIRDLLSTVANQNVGVLYSDPETWCNMDASSKARTRKALVALSDNRISYLVDKLQHSDYYGLQANELKDELYVYLLREEYSFLVIRHFQHTFGYDMLGCITDFTMQISSSKFEASVEWSTLDDILCSETRFADILDSIFRYAEMLPRSAESLKTRLDITGFKLKDVDKIAEIFSFAFQLRKESSLAESDTVCNDSSLRASHQMLMCPIYQALGIICYNFRSEMIHPKREGYSELASYADSSNQDYLSRAIYCIRIAISLSRYTRKSMLEALSSSEFSNTEEYKLRVRSDYTPSISRALRGLFYRHRTEDGELVHIMAFFQVCDGECGATEEHILETANSLVLWLEVRSGDTFTTEGHSPLLAGHDHDGKPVYIASLRSHALNSEYKYFTHDIAIAEGTKPEVVASKVHCTDKTPDGNQLPSDSYYLAIPVMRYDPQKYLTETYEWSFSRRLADKIDDEAASGVISARYDSRHERTGEGDEGACDWRAQVHSSTLDWLMSSPS